MIKLTVSYQLPGLLDDLPEDDDPEDDDPEDDDPEDLVGVLLPDDLEGGLTLVGVLAGLVVAGAVVAGLGAGLVVAGCVLVGVCCAGGE